MCLHMYICACICAYTCMLLSCITVGQLKASMHLSDVDQDLVSGTGRPEYDSPTKTCWSLWQRRWFEAIATGDFQSLVTVRVQWGLAAPWGPGTRGSWAGPGSLSHPTSPAKKGLGEDGRGSQAWQCPQDCGGYINRREYISWSHFNEKTGKMCNRLKQFLFTVGHTYGTDCVLMCPERERCLSLVANIQIRALALQWKVK